MVWIFLTLDRLIWIFFLVCYFVLWILLLLCFGDFDVWPDSSFFVNKKVVDEEIAEMLVLIGREIFFELCLLYIQFLFYRNTNNCL